MPRSSLLFFLVLLLTGGGIALARSNRVIPIIHTLKLQSVPAIQSMTAPVSPSNLTPAVNSDSTASTPSIIQPVPTQLPTPTLSPTSPPNSSSMKSTTHASITLNGRDANPQNLPSGQVTDGNSSISWQTGNGSVSLQSNTTGGSSSANLSQSQVISSTESTTSSTSSSTNLSVTTTTR